MKKQLRKLALRATNSLKVASGASLMLFVAAASAQTPITVENGDFQAEAGTKYTDWNSITGWTSDGPVTDSGVEADGTAFIKSSDASVYNVTSHVITDGEDYILSVGVLWDIWNATDKFTATLFYTSDGGATRTPLASQTFPTSGGFQLNANSTVAAVGAYLGIEFDNESNDGGDGWNGFDDVTLTSNSVLGINDAELNKNLFKVFPNPSNGSSFKIALNSMESSVNVKVYSVLGKIILNRDFAPSSKTIEVNQNLNSGIYIVKVNDKASSKLIVK